MSAREQLRKGQQILKILSSEEVVGWNRIKFGGFVGQSSFFFCVGIVFSPALVSLARIELLCCRIVCENFIYHSLEISR